MKSLNFSRAKSWDGKIWQQYIISKGQKWSWTANMSTVQGDRHSKWIGVSEIGVSEFLKGNTLIASNRAIVMFLSSQILRPFRDHTPIMARRTPRLRRVQTRRWAQRPCLKAYHTGRRTNLVTYNGSSSTNKMINPISENVHVYV